MASNALSEESISTLTDIIGVSKEQAIVLLKKYANIENAVNQYFEDPVRAVKPQAPQNQWEPADNLPYADDSTELPSMSMSRPPSRVDNRAVPIAIDGATSQAQGSSSAEEIQDADLQRAIAMSKQDLSGQETGIVGSGQQFGPANRPYYDANQWAVTTVESAREIVEHPSATKRQRLSSEPAFLRGSPETGYLAPLLNICHSIPLAREAFLLPSMKVFSYGYDPLWWSGTSDENTKSLSVEASESGNQDRHNFLAELQCLMAFLDGTDRAYGSVDALHDLRQLKAYHSESKLSQVFEAWVGAAMIQAPDSQLTQIFTSTALKAQDGDTPKQRNLTCLESLVYPFDGQTLTDLLDSTIWYDDDDQIDDIWIQECAEVFIMRLYDSGKESNGLRLEVPAVWYPDRYMYEFRDITRQWRREMLAIRHEIGQCTSMQRRCEFAQGPGKRVINIRQVLEAASNLSGSKVDSEELPNDDSHEQAEDAEFDFQQRGTRFLQSQLHAISIRIEEKVKVLEERKQDLQRQIRLIATQLTKPTANPELSPHHKYVLQGVSTKTNVTYIRRQNSDPDDASDDTPPEQYDEFQWWRIAWNEDHHKSSSSIGKSANNNSITDLSKAIMSETGHASDAQAYSVRKVEESDVLEAAKRENNSIVLVYATENAIKLPSSSPSSALRKFVEQDNRAFHEELRREHETTYRRPSQETNTTIMEDLPFDNRSPTPSDLREMTPMSMTSPTRDEDGQPSPKRAKGDEVYRIHRETDLEGGEPPLYETEGPKPPMQEKRVHKIGLLADQMLEKFGNEGADGSPTDGPIHIEHAKEPLR